MPADGVEDSPPARRIERRVRQLPMTESPVAGPGAADWEEPIAYPADVESLA